MNSPVSTAFYSTLKQDIIERVCELIEAVEGTKEGYLCVKPTVEASVSGDTVQYLADMFLGGGRVSLEGHGIAGLNQTEPGHPTLVWVDGFYQDHSPLSLHRGVEFVDFYLEVLVYVDFSYRLTHFFLIGTGELFGSADSLWASVFCFSASVAEIIAVMGADGRVTFRASVVTHTVPFISPFTTTHGALIMV